MLHSVLLIGEKRGSGTRATKVAPLMFLRDRHFFFALVVRPGEMCLGPVSLKSPCQRAILFGRASSQSRGDRLPGHSTPRHTAVEIGQGYERDSYQARPGFDDQTGLSIRGY